MRTTMPWVFPKLQERLGSGFDQLGFIDIYTGVLEEIALERERDGIEITCWERFVRTLARINAVAPGDAEDALERAKGVFARRHGIARQGVSPHITAPPKS